MKVEASNNMMQKELDDIGNIMMDYRTTFKMNDL